MDIPEQIGEKVKDTKLVSYCHVNVAFDEESPVVKYARRGSVQSVKSLTFSPETETTLTNGNGTHYENSCYENGTVEITDFGTNDVKIARPKRAVVRVRNAVKRYSKNGPFVLNDFGMTVGQGTIYSLLGSSGCGKTTMLTSILGMRHLQSGSITVFGYKPGTKESGVPGKRVGYMPQEIALYGDFSIDETLRYYGQLFGMTEVNIKTSRDFLMPFLDLPDETRRVGTLSSGQKRRVSLAVSFIHCPELLILDEPTVGVDALLREKIWNHLVDLVSQQNTTVIITTHYIEEARQSNTVGLMRGGRLLAENDPAELMRQFNASLLEDIVLRLCRNDKFNEDNCYSGYKEEKHDTWDSIPYSKDRSKSIISKPSFIEPKGIKLNGRIKESFTRAKALTMKNFFVMWRNLLLVLFMISTPSMMIILICTGIGNDPRPISLGLVNHESNISNCIEYTNWILEEGDDEGCDVHYLSCRYLSHLPNETIHLIEYETEDVAREAVQDGTVWGFLSIPEKYSDDVYVRASSGNVIDDEALDGSFITFQLDMTSKQISGPIKRILYDAYEIFIKELLESCGLNPKLGEKPLRALTPVFGTDDTDFREFIAPSLLLGLLFFFPLCSSSIQYIYDKKLGTLERAQVAGVQTWEIMIAFFITEGLVLLIQSGLTLSIITLMFGIEIRGSFLLTLWLCISMGIGGVSMGFLIGSFCTEEVQAVLLAMASFFPNFLLSGLLWPIEGMPVLMQYITYLLPCTFAAESIRSIISRGWGLTHFKVWPGFVTIILWIFIYWTVTICIHKIVLARK